MSKLFSLAIKMGLLYKERIYSQMEQFLSVEHAVEQTGQKLSSF